MLFNSVEFLLFFPVVTALYFFLPHAWRWPLLLAASCIFYMAFIPQYIFILLLLIVTDYAAAMFIEHAGSASAKKNILISSLTLTVTVLAFFKYFNFLNDNIAALAKALRWNYGVESLEIFLPIGLSFHTFQSMSYVIEVYRGNQKAERHFGIYALYVMFYPQLVAGPVERPQNLLRQFREEHVFDYARVTGGLKRMAFGLFKKMVVADNLAGIVDQVYTKPEQYTGAPLIIATVCFAYQIYCDFSGYSDIALGSAQVMGFRLMENFDRPYAATSIAGFWRKWHVSLTSWFRDYMYIPQGGSHVAKSRWYANLLMTFALSGLWHGASWNFVIWGALNAVYIILSSLTAGVRKAFTEAIMLDHYPRLRRAVQVTVTFLLACLAWIFFRAKNLSDAFYIVSHLWGNSVASVTAVPIAFDWMLLVFILYLEYVHHRHRSGRMENLWSGKPTVVRWSLYYALATVIIFFGHREQPFVYFQF